jgi:hypothetical protein
MLKMDKILLFPTFYPISRPFQHEAKRAGRKDPEANFEKPRIDIGAR